MNTTQRYCGAAAAAVLCTACATDFAPYNEVSGFRVLAVSASAPEMLPGDRTTLQALTRSDEPIGHVWTWCPVTAGPDSAHECLFSSADLPAGVPALTIGTSSVAQFEHGFTNEALDQLCELVAATPAPADAVRIRCGAATDIPVRLAATSGPETIVAITQVSLRSRAPLNNNPLISALTVADEAPLALATAYPLVIDVPADAAEQFDSDGEQIRETLTVTWFVSAGETDAQRTLFSSQSATMDGLVNNEWTTPETAGAVDLYVVIRDDRGGVSWFTRSVRVGGDS